MKNKGFLFFTIIAIVGFSIAACNLDGGDPPPLGGSPPLIEMVRISAGSFTMGSSDIGGAVPPHSVIFSYSFYIGKYPVTQAQYNTVMGNNPSYFQGTNLLDGQGNGNNLPVETVSWFDAVAFCNALSDKEGLQPVYTIVGTNVTPNWNANGYRLPTEAEWEYAAKGGNGSPENYTYSGSNNADEVAWHSGNRSHAGTHIVGTKAGNGLGIYDMSGNVWEWCWDSYGAYPDKLPIDIVVGTASGANRVGRGGGWSNTAGNARSALRGNYNLTLDNQYDNLGFRVVRP